LKTPKVSSNILILVTGIIWLIASYILLRRSYSWVDILTNTQLWLGTLVAIPFTLIKIYFIFHKLTTKNIKRIQSFKQSSISIWEFHLMKDKLLIVLMIILGSILRRAPFIPKYILFPIYLGIGIAMFYVWLLYLKTFIKQKK